MKEITINPATSRVGFRAYTRESYFIHDDPEDPKGYRGITDFWFQPPLPMLQHFLDVSLGFQVYTGEILPGTERGNHYHTHTKALDFFYITEGECIVALERLDASYQEIYYFDQPVIVIFPPFIPHLVRNIHETRLSFVAVKTWNYAQAGALTSPYSIAIAPQSVEQALRHPMRLLHGMFGFEHGERPTSQLPDGQVAGMAALVASPTAINPVVMEEGQLAGGGKPRQMLVTQHRVW